MAQTLSEQISDKIMEMIRTEGYQSGDKLPTEMDLAKRLGAGRNTVREALKLLASRNVIVIRQGAGSYVTENPGVSDDPFGFALAKDRKKLTQDLLQVRSIMEPPIAALAAENATENEIRRLEQILSDMEEVMKRCEDYTSQDVLFHTSIAQCTHNQVMKDLIPVISNGIAVFAEEVPEPEFDQTLRSHRKIFNAIRDHKSVEAQQEMQYHILFNNHRFLEE